jgi:hypothetical protein
MLLRLAHLGITNVFALLRLLPGSDRTRTRRSSPCATSSRCYNTSSTGSESGSTQPTGPGWPRCCTASPNPPSTYSSPPDAARRCFQRALSVLKAKPSELVTDATAVYPAVLDELIPSAWHHVERYANNPIEADHSQLKRRLRLMRGLRTDRTAQFIIAGHAFTQNLRRGHYELAVDAPPALWVATAFTELAQAI